MGLHQFIDIALSFKFNSEAQTYSVFLEKQKKYLSDLYDDLSTSERLEVFETIDSKDYRKNPTDEFEGRTPEEIEQALGVLYLIASEQDFVKNIHQLNTEKYDQDRSRRLKLFRCVPVWIAIDLAYVLQNNTKPPHRPTPFPV